MYLPQELYVYLFEYADNINTTKSLRSVCKVAHKASYDYFKILLKTSIVVKCNTYKWFLGKDINMDLPDHCYTPILPGRKIVSIQIDIKSLYNSIYNTKENIIIDYNKSSQ